MKNVMRRMSAVIMLGVMIAPAAVVADNKSPNQEIVSAVCADKADSVACEVENNTKGMSKWLIAIPVVGAIAATGGLAALPLLTGAVSAEVAMGAALALAVL